MKSECVPQREVDRKRKRVLIQRERIEESESERESFVSAKNAENYGVGATIATMSDGHEDKTTKHTIAMTGNHSIVYLCIKYFLQGIFNVQSLVYLQTEYMVGMVPLCLLVKAQN